MGENIHLEKHVADGVAVIRLDRPKVNALSSDMMRDLHAICDELAVDDTTRAVVVTGGRKNFAAGADISEFPSFTAETAQQFSNMFNDSLLALENLPQVTISAINGFALGGGLEVALGRYAVHRHRPPRPTREDRAVWHLELLLHRHVAPCLVHLLVSRVGLRCMCRPVLIHRHRHPRVGVCPRAAVGRAWSRRKVAHRAQTKPRQTLER